MTDRRPLATAMTEKLIVTGELTDPAWQRAFTDTPRRVFVPDHSLANVYSNDIDPALVNQAGLTLESLGYQPTLVAADGYTGLADGGEGSACRIACLIRRA